MPHFRNEEASSGKVSNLPKGAELCSAQVQVQGCWIPHVRSHPSELPAATMLLNHKPLCCSEIPHDFSHNLLAYLPLINFLFYPPSPPIMQYLLTLGGAPPSSECLSLPTFPCHRHQVTFVLHIRSSASLRLGDVSEATQEEARLGAL